MIVATAGHVDHGKTLLVKALTGVDADRLPEEKRRGMTIDLGFAYLPVASAETIGFVDVPGHERFIHNMVAGVGGIDFALFIIAADDGPMPQTREHLAILDLLAVRRGAVALTKTDRVPRARVHEVQNEVAALFSRTALAESPVFPVSAVTGEGIEDLRTHLLAAARNIRPRSSGGNFRLAIDRCFSLTGAGVIVTGTAVAGSLSAGDPVRVLGAGLTLRARAIHAQNAPSATGAAGQRCAINLAGAGLRKELIERGDWVVTGDAPGPVGKFDARLRVLESESRPLAHWTPVHVHLGAAEATGRVAMLEGPSIAPGASALTQLVLDRPLAAVHGDRFIVRDQPAQRTVGGGRVIDIFPSARGRAKPERLRYLAAMEHDDARVALSSLLSLSPRVAPGGLNFTQFAQNRNLTNQEAARLLSSASAKSVATSSGLVVFSLEDWSRRKTAVVEALSAWHRRAPDVIPSEEQVFLDAGIRLPKEVMSAIIAELRGDRVIASDPAGVRLLAHIPQLSAADAALWKVTEALLNEKPLRPPTVNEIAGALRLDAKRSESFLLRVSRLGRLVRVAENRFFLPSALQWYATFVEKVAAGNHGAVTVAGLRDAAKIGRERAVEILEYFDRMKFTCRAGAEHRVLRSTREAFGGE